MAIRAINSGSNVSEPNIESSTVFQPGGWGDAIVFGYMFRVISAVAAVIAPAIVILLWGALNGWQMSEAMLYFYGGAVIAIVSVGEVTRIGVYESRLKPKQRVLNIDNYSGVTIQFLEEHGYASLKYRVAKRTLDLAFSATAIVLMAAAILVISLMIRFDSPGPVLFKKRVIGFGGKDFGLYKFRTRSMSNGSETRAGRFLRVTAFDELPQLFNVLIGNMSVVGPRPHLRPMSQNLDGSQKVDDVEFELLRYTKPGLTGLLPGERAYPNAVVDYISHRSIWRDVRIILKTFSLAFRM